MKQLIKVGVLLGGASNEREVSLDSGRNVVYKLPADKYLAIPLFVDQNHEIYQISQKLLVRNSTAEIVSELDQNNKVLWSDLHKIVDFVFIALHGGIGENGAVQGALETLNLPYNGSSVFASALCINKYKTAQLLSSLGFDTPKNILISKNNWQANPELTLKNIALKIDFPIIVKPHDDGCSVLVQRASNAQELNLAIENIFKLNKEFALIEELITGMELTVGVLGNENPVALPPSQAISNYGILSLEEKFLPGAGENQTPAPLPTSALDFVKTQIVQVFKAAQCQGYARVDCFYQNPSLSPTGKERLVIIEINSLPALTPATCLFHQAAELEIKPGELLDQIIKLGLKTHHKAVISNQLDVNINLTN